MKKSLIMVLLVLVVTLGVFANGTDEKKGMGKDSYTIATVGKIDGISWFNRMREGVEKFGKDTGHDTFMISPAQADAAQQVQIIENLIAQGVDAIAVVPFSPESLEPVLKKARDAGIVVIVHEASTQVNADAIIEAFSNKDFGKAMAKSLVENMGEKGEVANFVGSLTSKSHNEQQDGVEEFLKGYPNIKLVSRRNEDYDDQTKAYEKTKELLTSYPNLTGIIGSASTTAPGAGLAIEEKNLQDKISVVGVATPSDTRKYINTGAVDTIAFWDPAEAAYVMNKMAVLILEGKKIEDKMDMGVAGYESIHQDANNQKLFFGNAWIFVNESNVDDFDF